MRPSFAIEALRTFVGNGVLRPERPGRIVRILSALWRLGMTPATGVAVAAERWPDRPAVIDDDGTLTFAELDRRAARLATALHARLGVRQGDTLAVLWPNHRGFVEALAAGSRLGADLLLLNTGLAAPQQADILRRAGARALLVAPELAEVGFDGPRTSDLDGMDGSPPPAPDRPGRLILLTSGTTGMPKEAGRRLSFGSLAEPFTSVLAALPLRSGDPMVIAPPLFHGLGLLWYGIALLLGCPVVLTRRFDPEAVLRLLAEHEATALIAVPVMLRRLLEAGRPALPNLRMVVSGGSALGPGLAHDFTAAFGEVLFNLYGSTEVGWASLATPADLRTAPGTVGRPPRGTTVRIIGPDGGEQPPGQIGRVCVAGGLTTSKGALMGTGDLGHRDGDGLLFIDGREDDMIVSGGENVFPQEVENLIARHPSVADVAVLGVPDEEYGQRLVAYVVPAVPVRAEELKEYVRANLARHKVPRAIEFVDHVPRNMTGKVDRSRG